MYKILRKLYNLTAVAALILLPLNAVSQTPRGIGGVTVEYWLRADEVATVLPADESDVTTWQDKSPNGRNFSNTETNPFYPRFIKSAMNYHSAVDFYLSNPAEGGPSIANNRRRKLLSETTFTPDAGRSYFVIWISRLDSENSSSSASVFGLNSGSGSGNTNGNQYGWTNAGRLWHRTRGAAYIHNNSTERNYGIGVSVLPNNGTTSQQQYLNALASTTTMGGRTLGVNSGQSVLGTTATAAASTNYFFGEVMEVIVLSKDGTGNTLTTDELKKINSTLAIKYGITLNTAQTEYILSDGTEVYNSNSTGYDQYDKDIFGIARNDDSGLYQKQSMSTDNPVLTVSLGTLAESNAENTSTMADKNALMFGATGQAGNAPYSYSEGTAFQNYTLQTLTDPVTGVVTTEKLTSIFNYKLRAKTTGQSSFTVDVKPGQGEWLLVSSDPAFVPASTRIYKIEGGKVQNLIINDGDYIGFAFYLKAPGGVTNGIRMWLNASKENTITLNSAGEVINWIDNAGFGTAYFQRSATGANAGAPLFLQCDERTNFHPTPLFRKWQDALITNKAPFSVAAPANSSLYAVVNHNLSSSDRTYFIGFGATTTQTNGRRPSFGVFRGTGANTSRGYGRIGSTGLSNSSTFLFNSGATTIAGFHWTRGSSITFDFDAYENTVNHNSGAALMNGPGMLGLGSSSNTYFLNGIMPEVIAYESLLSADEKHKINSYLGLKYALTSDLDKASSTVNFNFLLSDNTSVWNGDDSNHQSYHHNVASVVRDHDAELYNRQSRSTDTGAIVHMGIGSKLGCNAVLGEIVNDKTAVTWGHNDGSLANLSFNGDPNIWCAMDSRIEGRIWLADNTDFNQEIMVSAYGSLFPYNGANYQVFLLVADSEAKLTANQWDHVIPMTFADDKHVANYKFTDKYTYFTFGAKLVGSCEGCTFDGVKSLDFSRVNWPMRGELGPRNFNLGNDFNVAITVEDPGNRMTSGYPRSSTQRTLRERRRGTEAVTTKVVFTDDTGASVAAAVSFELFDIDRTGSRPDDIQVIGYCNGSPVYPKLSYTFNRPQRSRYTIGVDGKATAKPIGTQFNGNSGYTDRRGRVFVDFENAVQEVHIVYKTVSTLPNLTTYIGVGPMEFYCPQPLPAPDEEGLIFTKQGPPEIKLCEVVDYTFRAVNINCAEREVTFQDTLPDGMVWVNNSFSASGIDFDDSNISGYGTQTLTVSGLIVPGGGSTYAFRASAVFNSSAVAGVYQNQASLSHDRLGTTLALSSTDRLTGGAFTETTALDSQRPEKVVTSMTMDKNCFKLDGEIEVTLNINNPNTFSISEMLLSLDYNSEVFTVLPNSFQTSSGLTLPTDTGEEGSMEFDNFTLPEGTHWIRFKVKASGNIADYEINPVTFDPDDVSFGYDLSSESSDDCLSSSTANANGNIDLSFCSWCTKPSVGGIAQRSKAGISIMKEQIAGWPENVPNGYLVLEAGKKGMVLTRTTPALIGVSNWVKGMIIFDISDNRRCVSIYNGNEWKCIERSCND